MAGGSWGRVWSYFFRSDPRSEVEEELSFHLDERVREYVARGMTEEEARGKALERLGDLEGVRGACTELLASERKAEGRREWLKVSWLDFKLGFRMLLKYPGLTLVGGLALAFGIWVGAGTFEFVSQAMFPTIPLPEGDRIVGVRMWDARESETERRLAWDLSLWRSELETVDGLGAFRVVEQNLVSATGVTEAVSVAEISASGFDVARVAPALGRTLLPSDEAAGAPPVIVLADDVWRRQFGGDPSVLGEQVRFGRGGATVVGVMPAGFEFPISQDAWVPLRLSASEARPRQGPAVRVFGRLAPGASRGEAQAELEAVVRASASESPETHEFLRPEVMSFARSILYLPTLGQLGLWTVNLLVVLLVVLICGNVGLLLFARAASREDEMLVRSALGASRGRIVGQLFIEALVLGAVASAIGLAAAGFGLRWMYGSLFAEVFGRLPFWFDPSLSPRTVVYAVLLTLLAATIAGVVPGLKVTRGDAGARLRAATPGGGGARFGRLWAVVIVAQIAVTVTAPVFAYFVDRDIRKIRNAEADFPAERYLAARLEIDAGASSSYLLRMSDELAGISRGDEGAPGDREAMQENVAATTRRLEERLEAHPAVAGVTFGERLPRMYHPARLIHVDQGGAAPMDPQWPGYRISSVTVTPDYFDVLQSPVVDGRGFHSADIDGAEDRVVVVNEAFVERVLGGRNAIGRRIRYIHFEEWEEPRDVSDAPWYEIVGVVPNLGTAPAGAWKESAIYHPVAPGSMFPTNVAVHVRADPAGFIPELRSIAAAVDPGLRIYDPMPLDQVDESELQFYFFWFWMLVIVVGVALTLSLAGIYAVMAFAVSRRTREIGIRTALGAGRRRILLAVFAQPLRQIVIGVVVGVLLCGALVLAASGRVTPTGVAMLAGYTLLMVAVCLLACIVPTRRALAVEPMDALRADG